MKIAPIQRSWKLMKIQTFNASTPSWQQPRILWWITWDQTDPRTGPKNVKTHIFFTEPKYGRQTAGLLFTGARNDKKCWNCGWHGHTDDRCSLPQEPVRIAASKAQLLERKDKYRKPGMSPAKQVLYELSKELREIVVREAQKDSKNPVDVFLAKTLTAPTPKLNHTMKKMETMINLKKNTSK